MFIHSGEQDNSLSLYDDLNKHLLQADILADRNLKQLNEFIELCNDVDPEFLTPEVRDELFGACKKMVTSQSKNRQLQDSVREVKNFIRSKEKDEVIEKEELLEIAENSMASDISDPERNQAFKDLKYALRHVGETQRLDESTGPLTVLQRAVKPEKAQDDAESIILHQSQKMIDPYTKLEIANPVVNIKCKHLYERDVILPFLARNEKRRKITRCFHVGCNQELSSNDFIPFKK